MGLGSLSVFASLLLPAQGPDGVSHFDKMAVPIPVNNVPAARRAEIREMILFVSTDEGRSYKQAKVAGPNDETIPYAATSEGLHFFQIQVVGKNGLRTPDDVKAGPPGLKLMIDATAPVIRFGRAERVGDKVEVGWDLSEANPDWASFELEFRSEKGDWHPVAFRASRPSQGVRFAVPPAGVTAVRLRLNDLAGNRGEETVPVNGPPAPFAPRKNDVVPIERRADPVPVVTPTTLEGAPSALPGVTGDPVKPVPSDPVKPLFNETVKVAEKAPEASAVIAESRAVDPAANLPPAQIVNTPRFNVDYTITKKGPSAVSKVEVFVTTDNGRKWTKLSQTEKADGPVLIDLTAGRQVKRPGEIDGTYGLRLVPHSLAVPGNPPSSGDLPELRVDLDTVEPRLEVLEPIHNGRDTLTIKWTAKDRNIVSEPVTLEWAESPKGPFFPIASGDAPADREGADEPREGLTRPRPLANSGEYAWKIPANFPTHMVYVKYTARDAAGNVSEAISPNPFRTDMTKIELKVGGISPVAPK